MWMCSPASAISLFLPSELAVCVGGARQLAFTSCFVASLLTCGRTPCACCLCSKETVLHRTNGGGTKAEAVPMSSTAMGDGIMEAYATLGLHSVKRAHLARLSFSNHQSDSGCGLQMQKHAVLCSDASSLCIAIDQCCGQVL